MAFIYDMTDTWNNVLTTFTAIKMNVTNTASAAASLLMDLQVGSTSQHAVGKTGDIYGFGGGGTNYRIYRQVQNGGHAMNIMVAGICTGAFIQSGGFFNNSMGLFTSTDDSASPDVFLSRDAANTLAQRNGTNAQTFRVYGTFTDASNYERLGVSYDGSQYDIGTQQAGTGSTRKLLIGTTGSSALQFKTNASTRWQIDSDGHFTTPTDNTYDIGASGATRPRDIYIAGKFTGQVMTIASLPTPASAGQGARLFVTNALAPAFAVSIASGGAVNCPVYSDGSTWRAG